MPAAKLETFATWDQVLAHVRAKFPIWYQAPMDINPTRVVCVPRANQTLQVYPPLTNDADPFTADAGHLERFRRSPTQRIYP